MVEAVRQRSDEKAVEDRPERQRLAGGSWGLAAVVAAEAAFPVRAAEPLGEPDHPAGVAGGLREFDPDADWASAAGEVRVHPERRPAEPDGAGVVQELVQRRAARAQPASMEQRDAAAVSRYPASALWPVAGAKAPRAVLVLLPAELERPERQTPAERVRPVARAWLARQQRLAEESAPLAAATLELVPPAAGQLQEAAPEPPELEVLAVQAVRLEAPPAFPVRSGPAAASAGDGPRAAA